MRPYCLIQWFSRVISLYRSGQSIELIQSTAQHKNTSQEEKGNHPFCDKDNSQWQPQTSQPQKHRHCHTITKQGFRDWGLWGVYVRRIRTVSLGVNCVWREDRCVLSHQDSKFSEKCFWKDPHSYSYRLTATNRQTKHNNTLPMDGRQLTDGDNWFMLYRMYAGYGKLGGFQEKKTYTMHVCVRVCVCMCVSMCSERAGRGLWHEWVVKMPQLLWYVMIWGGSGKWLIRSMLLVELC